MSPGPTFERVYLELKRQLREGTRPPGAPLEPTAIGDELGTSFTPVRDALHRLVGEGLVENPLHNGFAVPRPTEQALRDLYSWNGDVVALLAARMSQSALAAAQDIGDREDVGILFAALAEASGNREHVRAIAQLNDRLAPYRMLEPGFLPDMAEERVQIVRALSSPTPAKLGPIFRRYHRQRLAIVPALLAKITGKR